MKHIISLGAGVQSTVMALMAAKGEIEPMPDCAIFADTGAEPRYVYDQLDMIETNVPFPIHKVKYKEGLERSVLNSIKDGKMRGAPPFFSANGGMIARQCTKEYKVQPIIEKIRELIGLTKGKHGPKEVTVIQWIGMSVDELVRLKPNQVKWILNRWPLVELGMYRYDCLRWMVENNYEPPEKSACYFCPYSSDEQWIKLLEKDKDAFRKAVEMDKFIREGVPNVAEQVYVHRSLKPLDEVDFNSNKDQFDMFDNECEGMCGI